MSFTKKIVRTGAFLADIGNFYAISEKTNSAKNDTTKETLKNSLSQTISSAMRLELLFSFKSESRPTFRRYCKIVIKIKSLKDGEAIVKNRPIEVNFGVLLKS